MLTLAYRRSFRPGESLRQRMRWSAAEARWRRPPLYDVRPPIEPEPPVAKSLVIGATLVAAETVTVATTTIASTGRPTANRHV